MKSSQIYNQKIIKMLWQTGKWVLFNIKMFLLKFYSTELEKTHTSKLAIPQIYTSQCS